MSINTIMIVTVCICATAIGAPQRQYRPQSQQPYNGPKPVPIVSESSEINPDGSFSYNYVSGDGTQAQAQGYLKNAGQKDAEAEVIQGSYSYTAPDGTPITVTYIADENGFRVEGAHLPTPPPIPEEIQKSLALISQTQSTGQRQYEPDTFRQQYQQRPYRF
ncbi:endocuticle structural glycoprotein SgAbd-2-like [Cylas formicarius]|uniref:endocuticle structural glycoprotein SgAbd-2-like n=1 Tax=Cylas formicarius TaxID=197179 RepID=UPI002958BDAC|nr:endocuticle structural glycoprotein SgAbd-2-like [Cylas formicarius]